MFSETRECIIEEGEKICFIKDEEKETRSFYIGKTDELFRQTITYKNGMIKHRSFKNGKLKEEKSYIGNVDYYYKNFSAEKPKPKGVPTEAKYVKVLKKWVVMSILKDKLHGRYEYYDNEGFRLLQASFEYGKLRGSLIEYNANHTQTLNVNIDPKGEITTSVNETGFPVGIYINMMEQNCR
ncbi:hypothetical protein [Leptospira sarikeiensis]|uniref:Toxin-antitoxin system YwqK family antitoxin n=1 Tax=Leptospira sarikeiensis TaxID=2484943 RepID=A0A4R9KBU3_9LEPT|nr:hypothetical protein [Leptospira sarikeiensis]TGL64214.1 hypothetical protein EHQ64_02445 [Leptospira sarikeiensis]